MFGSLTNWEGDLLDQFSRFQDDLQRLWGSPATPSSIRAVPRGSFPSINIGVTTTGAEVYVFAAGLDSSKLELSVQRNLLTISGEVPSARPEGATSYLNERYAGSFRRAISLPEDIDPDSASANYTNGVLRISFQRKEEARPRKIQVNS